jgi:two-component system sensor histidine kinase AlgZ
MEDCAIAQQGRRARRAVGDDREIVLTTAASTAPEAKAPDTCNAGVALRAFVLSNAVAVLLAFDAGSTPTQWWPVLQHGFAVAEPATTLWLAAMCASALRSVKARMLLGVAAGAAATWLAQFLLGWALQPLAPLPDWRPALLGGCLAALFLHGLRQRALALQPAMVQARLAELQARIRPHFLFNALNAASALVHEQPERAEQVLDDLALLFRATVSSPGTMSAVRDEIEVARRYLAIEEVRFGPRMQVTWDVEPGLDALSMPALTLQPLVENAVRHGVESLGGDCRIAIALRRAQGMLEIEVCNDWREAASTGTGVALANITQRLRLLYDITAELRHGPLPGQDPPRYRVLIRLPL